MDDVFYKVLAAVSAALASLAVQAVIRWSKNRRKRRKSGIRRIYDEGSGIKNVREAIANAEEICLLAVGGHGFMGEHRKTIENRLKEFPYLEMRLLLVDPNSVFSEELRQIEGAPEGYYQDLVNATLAGLKALDKLMELDKLRERFHPEVKFFEVRWFNTQFRNPIILCKRREEGKERVQAWITMTIPGKVAMVSPSFELDEDKSRDCYAFFDKMWNYCEPSVPVALPGGPPPKRGLKSFLRKIFAS